MVLSLAFMPVRCVAGSSGARKDRAQQFGPVDPSDLRGIWLGREGEHLGVCFVRIQAV